MILPRASRVEVGSRGGSYPVLVGPGLLASLGEIARERVTSRRYAVVADERVARLYGDAAVASLRASGAQAILFAFPPGEPSKTRAVWADLTDRLLAAGHGRDSAVVALGGGVTGDLAGFVAATFARGVPLLQVPTTTLAMIDASVGGKTAVDVPMGKNLVGAFHPPAAVIADVTTLETLERAVRAQGFAEAVKHAAILDAPYLDALEEEAGALLEGGCAATSRAVLRSVELKAKVVSRDEREGGIRRILNFGHTLGHGLEAASAFRLSHGEAVAIGMVLEARIGERRGVTAPGTAGRLGRALSAFELPTEPPTLDGGRVWEFVRQDK